MINNVNTDQQDFSLSTSTITLNNIIRYRNQYCENLGITYSGSTFTICSGDGSAFSANNLGYVNISSKTYGREVLIPISSNVSFVDSTGSSEISGNLFGLTTSIATTVDIPFYIYAVLNDAENAVAFMISRVPFSRASPPAATIGMPSSAVADTTISFFSFDNITAADYESNPCLCLGSFRMRMNSSNDWAVQTLNGTDGIGQFQEGQIFSFPRGQFSAASSKFFLNNGGTAPDDAAGTYYYTINPYSAVVITDFYCTALTGGSGAVELRLANITANAVKDSYVGNGMVVGATTSIMIPNQTNDYINFYSVNDLATALLLNSNFSSSRQFQFNFSYRIYNTNT